MTISGVKGQIFELRSNFSGTTFHALSDGHSRFLIHWASTKIFNKIFFSVSFMSLFTIVLWQFLCQFAWDFVTRLVSNGCCMFCLLGISFKLKKLLRWWWLVRSEHLPCRRDSSRLFACQWTNCGETNVWSQVLPSLFRIIVALDTNWVKNRKHYLWHYHS